MTRIVARISSVTAREILDGRAPARGGRVAKHNQFATRKPWATGPSTPAWARFPAPGA